MNRLDETSTLAISPDAAESVLGALMIEFDKREISNLELHTLVCSMCTFGMIDEQQRDRWLAMIDQLNQALTSLRRTRANMMALLGEDLIDEHLRPQHEEVFRERKIIATQVHRTIIAHRQKETA